jgi:hypothetical protein
VTAQGGQVFRAPAGSWAIRFYDAAGQRRQRNGSEPAAKLVLR